MSSSKRPSRPSAVVVGRQIQIASAWAGMAFASAWLAVMGASLTWGLVPSHARGLLFVPLMAAIPFAKRHAARERERAEVYVRPRGDEDTRSPKRFLVLGLAGALGAGLMLIAGFGWVEPFQFAMRIVVVAGGVMGSIWLARTRLWEPVVYLCALSMFTAVFIGLETNVQVMTKAVAGIGFPLLAFLACLRLRHRWRQLARGLVRD